MDKRGYSSFTLLPTCDQSCGEEHIVSPYMPGADLVFQVMDKEGHDPPLVGGVACSLFLNNLNHSVIEQDLW